jgi:hypothetical protein
VEQTLCVRNIDAVRGLVDHDAVFTNKNTVVDTHVLRVTPAYNMKPIDLPQSKQY